MAAGRQEVKATVIAIAVMLAGCPLLTPNPFVGGEWINSTFVTIAIEFYEDGTYQKTTENLITGIPDVEVADYSYDDESLTLDGGVADYEFDGPDRFTWFSPLPLVFTR